MDSRQLVDALAAHVSLYHRSSPRPTAGHSAAGPRAAALRWFSTLSVPHRQAALTVVDPDFLSILLRMLSRIRSGGHGVFLLLPDIPAPSSSTSSSDLPSLCFRRLRGLLRRTSAADVHERSVSRDVLLFGSREGEKERGCELDSFTIAGDLVRDVDRFLETMDGVSDGRFLRDVENRLGLPWLELPWLKDKGFYSIEAFIVNRLEVALRASWMNSGCSRKGKGGGKAREVVPGNAGVGSNSFWRKKGCLDWWAGLDQGSRKNILSAFFGKSAPSMVNEILKRPCFHGLDTEMSMRQGISAPWERMKQLEVRRGRDRFLDFIPTASGRWLSMTNGLKSLSVIQEISTMLLHFQCSGFDRDDLFFSRFWLTDTISDFLLRKLRAGLMIVSIEYVKLELMGDANLKNLPITIERNAGVRLQKGKKKGRSSKRLNSFPERSKVDSYFQELPSDHGCEMAIPLNSRSILSSVPITSLATVNQKNCTPCVSQEYGEQNTIFSADCKGHISKKKSRKKKTNRKISASNEAVEVKNPWSTNKETAILSAASEETKLENSLASTSVCMVPPISENIVDNHVHLPAKSTSNCDSAKTVLVPDEPVHHYAKENNGLHNSQCHASQGFSESSLCFLKPTTNFDDVAENPGHDAPMCQNSEHESFRPSVSVSMIRSSQDVPNDIVEVPSNDSCEHSASTFSGGTSYEWPTIAPLHCASVNSQHLPAATDRLHLDVGQKYPINCHQTLLPPRHQPRISSVECGHNRILPSLTLPMSYDWPPMLKSYSRLAQTSTTSCDSGYAPRFQPPFLSGFSAHRLQVNVHSRGNALDPIDICESKSASDLVDDNESYWCSEEESDTHLCSGRDYNKYFGGGVMYWNTTESGTTRPPSYSSDDNCWAWHEAELNRTIDDMVGMPALSASYNASGLASPPAGPFCSPFDHLGQGLQSVGYAMPVSDPSGMGINCMPSSSDVADEQIAISKSNSSGGVEGVKIDPLPYTMLRPIIIPSISRKGSRSEFEPSSDTKRPCIPSVTRDLPRVKRPPSPVVLCVPRVPRPPPPSPVGDMKKRGVPTVRSGSSSPRHWGLRSCYHGENNFEGCNLHIEGVEVVWPSWGSKGFSTNPMMQSMQGSLLQEHLVALSHLPCDQEHTDAALHLQPSDILDLPDKTSLSLMHSLLHGEIDFFCKQVAAENLVKKPYINWAVKRVTRSLQVLWPRSRTNIFGSNATGLALPSSDVDLVVSLPPVRNLEPIKEAGILEGRNGIKETCLQHAARYLANQEWVRNDSLKTIENAAIPVIMLVADVPRDDVSLNQSSSRIDKTDLRSVKTPAEHVCHSDQSSSDCISCLLRSQWRESDAENVKSIHLDISFKSPSHTGLQTSELVRELTKQFPAIAPLALVLKQFLADRSLDHSYSGGISSYCLVLLITRFLQHEHHIGRQTNMNLGSLLMDFLYFFGNVFDPRQMRISIQGSGVYMNRERGHSIDPIHIDDPLFPTNNVGRNCFRIHQCIKAFADAYSLLKSDVSLFSNNCVLPSASSFSLLQRIIPSISPVRQFAEGAL